MNAQEAVEYNTRQGFTTHQVRMIQRVVGAKPDGVWGPKTVEAIYNWQKERGLAADGKVWKSSRGNTWPVMLSMAREDDTARIKTPATVPCPANLTLGCWVDDSQRIQQHEYVQKMADLGFNSMALMVDRADEPWTPLYTEAEIDKIAKLADDKDMEIVLTTWPYPNRQVLDTMADRMARLMLVAPEVIRAAEGDTEFNWHVRHLDGFATLDEAEEYWSDKLTEICEPTEARREQTTFTSHTENGPAAGMAIHMDRLLPQAYSVRSRKKRDGSEWLIPWAHTYGPGQMQKHTLDRTMQVPGVPESIQMGCGLAAYDQGWPGHDPEEAMRVAYSTAVEYGCVEIRYWSFKWIFGHLANQYAINFFESLMAKV